MKNTSITIVVAEFNKELVDAMVSAASEELVNRGATLSAIARVAGCYEVPLIVDQVLRQREVTAVVALGYIERGETLHGEVMGHVVHTALMQISLAHRKPIGIGIIGPGATPAQAEVRKDGYARAAVHAMFQSLAVSATLSPE